MVLLGAAAKQSHFGEFARADIDRRRRHFGFSKLREPGLSVGVSWVVRSLQSRPQLRFSMWRLGIWIVSVRLNLPMNETHSSSWLTNSSVACSATYPNIKRRVERRHFLSYDVTNSKKNCKKRQISTPTNPPSWPMSDVIEWRQSDVKQKPWALRDCLTTTRSVMNTNKQSIRFRSDLYANVHTAVKPYLIQLFDFHHSKGTTTEIKMANLRNRPLFTTVLEEDSRSCWSTDCFMNTRAQHQSFISFMTSWSENICQFNTKFQRVDSQASWSRNANAAASHFLPADVMHFVRTGFLSRWRLYQAMGLNRIPATGTYISVTGER